MNGFAPRFDILPAPQRTLWPELALVPRRFVLYGGTAIALRLGHRSSVDFDDGDLRQLPLAVQEALTRQAADLKQIAPMERRSDCLSLA